VGENGPKHSLADWPEQNLDDVAEIEEDLENFYFFEEEDVDSV